MGRPSCRSRGSGPRVSAMAPGMRSGGAALEEPRLADMRTWDPPPGAELFSSPEQAALADWSRTPRANARVVEVRPGADEGAVWVVVQLGEPTGFHDQDIVTCLVTQEGLWWAGGSTGASSR